MVKSTVLPSLEEMEEALNKHLDKQNENSGNSEAGTKNSEYRIAGRAPYNQVATKSDHIRTYLKNHRTKADRRPKLVVSRLAEHDIHVTTSLVSHIKRHPGKKAGKNKKTVVSRDEFEMKALVAAKKFFSLVGNDRNKAIKLLDVLKRIV